MGGGEDVAEPLRLEREGDGAPMLVVPPGGWTVDHLDALPETHHRYELTDGALTVSPTPSSLHQMIAMALGMSLSDQAPDGPIDVDLIARLPPWAR